MYELKKTGKVFTSKFVGAGPSSYKKRIYRAAVSQRLRNTGLSDWGMKLTIRLYLVWRLGMNGALPLLPHAPLCLCLYCTHEKQYYVCSYWKKMCSWEY